MPTLVLIGGPGHNEPNSGHPLVELRRDSRSLVAETLRPDLKVAEVAKSLKATVKPLLNYPEVGQE